MASKDEPNPPEGGSEKKPRRRSRRSTGGEKAAKKADSPQVNEGEAPPAAEPTEAPKAKSKTEEAAPAPAASEAKESKPARRERSPRAKSAGRSERTGRRSGASSSRSRSRSAAGGDVEELGASSGIDVLEMPAERRPRKEGALEPGLTLKDLLPFLRPPKTVLILGAATGSGHNRTGAALFEAFRSVDRNLVVRQHDVLDFVTKETGAAKVRELLEALALAPTLQGSTFETVAVPEAVTSAAAELEAAMPNIFTKKMDQLVVEKRPDHVVCTHWLPLKHLEALAAEGRFTAPVTAVVPDPDIHERWMSSLVTHWIVPDDQHRARLQRLEIDPSLVTVTGVPVAPPFTESPDRGGIMRELGLRSQVPTILLRPAGIGDTERVVGLVSSLLESVHPANWLIVAGKDDELRAALEAIEVPNGSHMRAFGFIQNMHELMGVSDVMVTRAAPHTVAEAGALGLPLLLLRPTSGIEDRMADTLLRIGSARKVYGDDDLLFFLQELFKNKRLLRDMQDAADRSRKRGAVSEATERIARLVK